MSLHHASGARWGWVVLFLVSLLFPACSPDDSPGRINRLAKARPGRRRADPRISGGWLPRIVMG